MSEDNSYYRGRSTLTARISHAIRGLVNAWRKEPNFRIEVLFALMVLGALIILPLTGVERAILLIITGLVLAVEIINSVFERLLDVVHPHFSPEVKRIKDTMAGAVLLVSVISVVVGIATLIRPLLAFDVALNEVLIGFRTEQIVQSALAVTLLGDIWVIFAATAVVSIVLLYRRRYALFSFLAGSVFIGEVVLIFLKILFARERPFGAALIEVIQYSFPSGHVFRGVVFWLAATYILTTLFNLKRIYWILPGVLIILIAWSRVILSVHWFSDIVGGALIGFFWLLIWYGISKRFFGRYGDNSYKN